MSEQFSTQALTPEDSATFEALVIKHKPTMADFARQRTRDQDKANELVQKVLTKLGSRLAEGRTSLAKLRNPKYLLKAIKNQWIDDYRKEQRENKILRLDETVEDEEGEPQASPALIEASEKRYREQRERDKLRELEQAVERKLVETSSPQQEAVFRLVYEGYSITEIAERLRLSGDRVKKDYEVAKKKLKHHIRDHQCPKSHHKR